MTHTADEVASAAAIIAHANAEEQEARIILLEKQTQHLTRSLEILEENLKAGLRTATALETIAAALTQMVPREITLDLKAAGGEYVADVVERAFKEELLKEELKEAQAEDPDLQQAMEPVTEDPSTGSSEPANAESTTVEESSSEEPTTSPEDEQASTATDATPSSDGVASQFAKEVEAAADADAAKPATEQLKKLTTEDIRQTLRTLQMTQGKDAAIGLLKKYGATNVSTLEEEHYAAFVDEAQKELT